MFKLPILIALCFAIRHIQAAPISDSPSSNQPTQFRSKRAIVFRPLFVYRNQHRDQPEARQLSDGQRRTQQQQPLYEPEYHSQQPWHYSQATNSYDYGSQSAYYSPYDGNYYWPYYSAPAAAAPAQAQYYNYPSQTAAAANQYYYPTSTARPIRSTTTKFRPYPFWG